ncbi:probable phosphoglycerate mutase Pmu1p [Monosporozyma unispora]|nr:putative phosphoglycerate mutase pmu1 [Kazachstania unispora]
MTVTKTYRALPGYFAAFPNEDAEAVDSSKINHLKLINHKSWKELYDSIPQDTATHEYKLLVVARHGQGYHNAAIERYGENKWDEYWSLLNGDEYGDWVDSKLTPVGKDQVRGTGDTVLLPMIQSLGFLPHVFFSSPMRRCLETFIESWTQVFQEYEPLQGGVSPIILENIRETLGEHTCDKRVDHSIAVEEYQEHKMETGHTIQWKYSEDYPESDQLWRADWREPESEMDDRVNEGLLEIFENVSKDERFISITCHSGVIGSILRDLNHPAIENLATGKVVCTVVEVEKH